MTLKHALTATLQPRHRHGSPSKRIRNKKNTSYNCYYNKTTTKTIPDNILLQGTNENSTQLYVYGLDSGASCTAVDEKKFLAYKQHVDKEVRETPSLHYFLCDRAFNQIMWSFIACIPISQGSCLPFKTYIVPIEIPVLIGLDVPPEFGLYIGFKKICLKYNKQHWKIHINIQGRLVYIQHDKNPF